MPHTSVLRRNVLRRAGYRLDHGSAIGRPSDHVIVRDTSRNVYLQVKVRNRALSWLQPELRLLSKLLDDWADANTVSVNNPLYCCSLVSITIQHIQAAIGLARFQARPGARPRSRHWPKQRMPTRPQRRTAHPVAGVGVGAGSNLPHARNVRPAAADDPRAARIPHSYAGAISS
jgi:hypothetical protein